MGQRVVVSPRTRERLKQWYSEEVLEDTPVFRGSLIGWLFGLLGQRAVTINKTVHLTHRAPDLESVSGTVLLGHEYYHILQQREMGWWKFFARYLWRWRPSHITQGWKHPLEQPAYVRGAEIRSTFGPDLSGH